MGLVASSSTCPLGIQADKAEEDASRLQKQRYVLLQTQLCLFHYLIKEHTPITPNASGGLIDASTNTTHNLQHSRLPLLTTKAQIDSNEADLDIAPSKALELLSLPGISVAQSPNAGFAIP